MLAELIPSPAELRHIWNTVVNHPAQARRLLLIARKAARMTGRSDTVQAINRAITTAVPSLVCGFAWKTSGALIVATMFADSSVYLVRLKGRTGQTGYVFDTIEDARSAFPERTKSI